MERLRKLCCCCKKKKPKGEGEGDESTGGRSCRCVVSPNMMKLITLSLLLLSDLEVTLSIFASISYASAGGVFWMMIATVGFFFAIYVGGCTIAAREANKFL